MKHFFVCILLVISFLGNSQNPADVDLTLGNNYASFSFVDEITVQPDGKILVGGAYYFTNGRVARFNPDGSTDTSFQINSFTHNGGTSVVNINDIVVQPDGKILIGGSFSSFNGEVGQSVNSIVRLNADGTKDTSFMPPHFTSGGANTLSIVLQPDGKIIIGGSFRVQVNGHSQYHSCRLNPDGSIDNSFDFGINGGPPQATSNIRTIALQPDGKVLLGGSFTTFNGQPQGTLIRLNSNGSKDTTFDIGTGGPQGWSLADIVVQPDNKILINGGFQSWNGQAKAHLIRLNEDGSIDNDFINEFSVNNVGSSTPATIVLRSDGKILVGGDSFFLHGQKNIWLLNNDGSLDTSLTINDNLVSSIRAIYELDNGKMLIGGQFMSLNGKMRDSYARIHPNGLIDNSFLSQGINDEVVTMAIQQDEKVILGGNFTTFDTVTQNRIIRINGLDGTKDSSFNIGSGFNNSVKIITIQPNGKIIVGGEFTTYNEQVANHLIRLNEDGTIDNSFNIGLGFNGYVKTIILQPDGKIIVGGNYTEYDGQIQNYIIRLNENGSKDSTFNIENSFNGRITSLLLQNDGKILVGGNFTTFNGNSQRYLIRLNEDGTKDTSFIPYQNNELNLTFTTEDAIFDFAVTSDKIYVVTQYLRRLNYDGSIDNSFTVGYSDIHSIAIQENGKILVGGTFDFFYNNGGWRRGLVQLNYDGSIDTNFDISLNGDMQYGGFFGINVNDSYGCKDILIQPDNKIWLSGNFFAYRGEESFAAIRLVGENTILSNNDFDNYSTNSISIYPNPTYNTFNIKSKNGEKVNQVEIYNAIGQLVLKTANYENIDISMLSDDIYFVKVNIDNEYITSKLIKK